MASDHNPYKQEIDFAELALRFPSFNKHLKKNGQLDFSDPEAVKQLTFSLLKRDFNLELDLPDDRLCPPVPNRLNYLLFLHKLLDTSSPSYSDAYSPARTVLGLDIGTGSSCIYPLLGCSLRPNWRFLATELDEKNHEYANKNVSANTLAGRIRVHKVQQDSKIFALDDAGLERVDFTMCNPPFYSSQKEMLDAAKSKSRPPRSACTGAEIEMVTAGGEVAFAGRMIDESKELRDRVQWFSTMVGKLSSVGTLVERLKAEGVTNWAASELVQGGKTRRWVVAWSWQALRPSPVVARGIRGLSKHLLPFPSEFVFTVEDDKASDVATQVDEVLSELDLSWRFKPEMRAGVGFAAKNVWSRAARRKSKAKAQTGHVQMDEEEDGTDPALGFRINVEQDGAQKNNVEVKIRWLLGFDHVLFESFCGMVRRSVKEQ